MAKPKAPVERPQMEENNRPGRKAAEEKVKRESSAQYKSSIEKINRSQDRDIERALRH
jgi:hypothetical protein